MPHYFPQEAEDLEGVAEQPLEAECETDDMVCRAAESVIGDWEEEDVESLEHCLAESSRAGSFSSCAACSIPVHAAPEPCTLCSIGTGTPSISGTDGSSPSNGMSPQGGSPTFMLPSQSLGVPVAEAR